MKRSAIFCLTTLLAAGAQAQTFNDTARVRNVNPQYENVSVPSNECTSQWVTEQRRRCPGQWSSGAWGCRWSDCGWTQTRGSPKGCCAGLPHAMASFGATPKAFP